MTIELTPKQYEVLEEARNKVYEARRELARGDYEKEFKELLEMEARGEVFIKADSRTLDKLEKLGFIEVINSARGRRGMDTIKVLNW